MVTAATSWDILDSAKNLITVRDFIKFLEHMSTPNGSFVDSMDHKKKVLLWDCNDGEAAEFTVSHPKCIIRWNLWKLLANFLFKEGECVRVAFTAILNNSGTIWWKQWITKSWWEHFGMEEGENEHFTCNVCR